MPVSGRLSNSKMRSPRTRVGVGPPSRPASPDACHADVKAGLEAARKAPALDVWSRDLVVRVMHEPGWLFCPGFTNGFVGREAA